MSPRGQMASRLLKKRSRVGNMFDELAGNDGIELPANRKCFRVGHNHVPEATGSKFFDLLFAAVNAHGFGKVLEELPVQPVRGIRLDNMASASHIKDPRPSHQSYQPF